MFFIDSTTVLYHSKNAKYIYQTLSGLICLINNPARFLSVQYAVSTNRQLEVLHCFLPSLTQLPTNTYVV